MPLDEQSSIHCVVAKFMFVLACRVCFKQVFPATINTSTDVKKYVMSGGFFDYNEWHIDDVAERLENEIENNLVMPEYFSEEQWEKRGRKRYSEEVYSELVKGLKILRTAALYAHRIDYLLSGDDSEESFLRRLKKGLDDVEITFPYKEN